MRCPYCNTDNTKVIDSRDAQEGRAVRRRRCCSACGKRFSTYEAREISRILVVKRDGTKEEYDRTKVERGLRRAFEKRPGAEEKIEAILSELDIRLQEQRENEIPSREIGNLILKSLKAKDEVAYIRFASVYKSFGSVKSFRRILESMGE
ncbi:MAG: transcriptional regulator NrdR [Candidatus Moraniibacteriota bacterium]